MAGIIGIVGLKNLEKLIAIAKADEEFDADKAEVFINQNNNLAITWCNEEGYQGYFLDFTTGNVYYSV